MKIAEDMKRYRSMKDAELQGELAKNQKELTLLSLKVKAGKADNMSEIGKLRKNIARINTILSEMALSDEE